MKYRNHFVTNSSSSCFVAVYQKPKTCIDSVKKKIRENSWDSYPAGEDGNIEFGWEQKVHDDFDSRLNYAMLQVLFNSDKISEVRSGMPELLDGAEDSKEGKLVSEVFERALGIPVDWSGLKEKVADTEAYIDHQSVILFPVIFENSTKMYDFLFGKKSAVITGNDNVYEEEGEFNHLEEPYKNNPDFKINGQTWF